MLDSAGAVMLIPFALGLGAGAFGGGFAVHTRRAWLPVLPFLVTLVVVLLLGTPAPASLLVQGVGAGVVSLVWIGHRSARNQTGRDNTWEERRVPIGRLASAAACVLVATALVSPLAAGTSSQPQWVLREALKPLDTEPVTTPLTVFRTFRPGHNPTFARSAVFRVTGAKPGTALRIAVLDSYDGERWYAAPDASKDDLTDRFLRVSTRIDNPGRGQLLQAKVSVEKPWLLDWLPTIGRVQSFDFLRDSTNFRRDKIRYNRSTGTAILLGGVLQGDAYTMESLVGPEALRANMRPWPEPNEQLREQAAFLDVPAQAWTTGVDKPMEQLFAIGRRMKARGHYSDGDPGWQAEFTAGHDADKLLNGFINDSQMVGNDEQYAATMALLANRIGIPARVVVGGRTRKDGTILGRDIGAWVEVRIADGSWRTLPNSEFMSRRMAIIEPKNLPKVTIPEQNPQDNQQQQDPKDEETEKQEEREPKAADDGFPTWLLFPIPVVLVAMVPILKAVRRRRRARGDAEEQALGGWAEVVDTAKDLGRTVPARPRPDQAAGLSVPASLARHADVAAFTDQKPELPATYWSDVAAVRSQLAEEAPVWRRLLAVVNPASLVRRGPR
jgi:hypothetical protein